MVDRSAALVCTEVTEAEFNASKGECLVAFCPLVPLRRRLECLCCATTSSFKAWVVRMCLLLQGLL